MFPQKLVKITDLPKNLKTNTTMPQFALADTQTKRKHIHYNDLPPGKEPIIDVKPGLSLRSITSLKEPRSSLTLGKLITVYLHSPFPTSGTSPAA